MDANTEHLRRKNLTVPRTEAYVTQKVGTSKEATFILVSAGGVAENFRRRNFYVCIFLEGFYVFYQRNVCVCVCGVCLCARVLCPLPS